MEASKEKMDDVPPWFAEYMDNLKDTICKEVTAKVVYTVNLMMEEKFKKLEDKIIATKTSCTNDCCNVRNELGDSLPNGHLADSSAVNCHLEDRGSILSLDPEIDDDAPQSSTRGSDEDKFVVIPMPACFDMSIPLQKAAMEDSVVYVKKRITDKPPDDVADEIEMGSPSFHN